MNKFLSALSIVVLFMLASCAQPVAPLGPGQALSEAGVPRAPASEPDPGAIPAGLKVYISGNPAWVVKTTTKALMLQGGGTDCDAAFLWLIGKSGGGDFEIGRASCRERV
mgnify:CR=1 FL=1